MDKKIVDKNQQNNQEERQSNISITARANKLIFFTNNKAMFILHIHKDKVREKLFLSATIDLNKKISPSHK